MVLAPFFTVFMLNTLDSPLPLALGFPMLLHYRRCRSWRLVITFSLAAYRALDGLVLFSDMKSVGKFPPVPAPVRATSDS